MRACGLSTVTSYHLSQPYILRDLFHAVLQLVSLYNKFLFLYLGRELIKKEGIFGEVFFFFW